MIPDWHKKENRILHRSFISDIKGMTLVDMAIALLVIGLLAAPAIKAYDLWRVQKAEGRTYESLYTIKKAIANFYYQNNRYPCPADLTLGVDDPNYGAEPALPCDGALAAGAGTPDAILAGGVPFVTLNIPSVYTLDGWSNKITYVVTREQAVTVPMPTAGGKITVKGVRNTEADVCDTAESDFAGGNGHFVLISHGPRGVGAYNAEGNLVQACDPATVEGRNCDYMIDSEFLHHNCSKSDDILNGGYFDDIIDYQASIPTQIWNYTAPNDNDIASNAGYIGINNDAPGVELDVNGNVKTRTDATDPLKKGNVNAEEFCDTSDANCMPPVKIGGFDAQMNCNTHTNGGAIIGIGNNAVNCDLPFIDPSLPDVGCPAGEFVTGFSGGQCLCSGGGQCQ
jgi:type II secretory pathway pseudopilin PulG